MNLDQIQTQCFILALFIRDDGERFLLGSGAYEFKDKQLHFTANSYQNDIVEVQGSDGVLLAGQVRRAVAQAFDGFIGDATVSKQDIETYRKNFIAFFRKDYHYKVVYVFPDGTAIQRRQGFIVDAPEVKELYQYYPVYHISLNFEDVNYYSYWEDPSGHEVYGKSAKIYLSSGVNEGGLIWDDIGTTTLSGSGTSFTLSNYLGVPTLTDVQLKGDTTQNGTPTPDSPQTVNTVTGEQTVTISDGDSQSATYTIDLGSTELCKIGDYQDKIYKSGDDWYVRKEVGKVVLDTTSSDWVYGQLAGCYSLLKTELQGLNIPASSVNYVATTFTPTSSSSVGIGRSYAGGGYFNVNYDGTSTAAGLADFKTWLSSSNSVLYAPLTTPTDTKITDADLIADLEALAGADCYAEQTNFAVTASGLPGILAVEATAPGGGGVVWDNIGATWEKGGGGGATIIPIESIDKVYPIWEVTGPAINPEIEVIETNTAITYSGTVTSSQTLRIDMVNKTATLNGTSVISKVSGEWISLNPGDNRVVYTTDNNDADYSTIYWQEVVG